MAQAILASLLLAPSAQAMDVQSYDPQWREKSDITAVRAWEKANCSGGNCFSVSRENGPDAWRGLLTGMHYANVEILRRRYSIPQSIIDDVLKEQLSKPLEQEPEDDAVPPEGSGDSSPVSGTRPSPTTPNDRLQRPRKKTPGVNPSGTGVAAKGSSGQDADKDADKDGSGADGEEKEAAMAPDIPSALGGGGAGSIAGKAQGMAAGFAAGAGPASDGGFDPGRRAASMGSLRPGSASSPAMAGAAGGAVGGTGAVGTGGHPAPAMGASPASWSSPNPSGSDRQLASARRPGAAAGSAPEGAFPGGLAAGTRREPPPSGGFSVPGGAGGGYGAGSEFGPMRPVRGPEAGRPPGRVAEPKESQGLSTEEEAELDNFLGLLDAAAKTGDFNTRAADASMDRTLSLGEPTRAGSVVRAQARSILDKTGRSLTPREKQETAFLASSLGVQATPTEETRLVTAVQEAEPSRYRADKELSWWRRLILWIKRFFARMMG